MPLNEETKPNQIVQQSLSFSSHCIFTNLSARAGLGLGLGQDMTQGQFLSEV